MKDELPCDVITILCPNCDEEIELSIEKEEGIPQLYEYGFDEVPIELLMCFHDEEIACEDCGKVYRFKVKGKIKLKGV